MTRRVEYVALDEIRAADVNPKQHDIGEICASIIRQGFVEPPVVDERTGKLVAGHGRLEALAAMQKQGTAAPAGIQVLQGRWFAPVVRGWASKDEAAARAYLVSSNRLVELGGWHDEALTRLLAEMAKESPDALVGTGFDVDDAERRLWALEKDQIDTAALDVVPELRPTNVKSGDMIELGDHRIICGDSTDVTVVSRLMGGEKADICWTDPPWNVAYGQRTKKKRKAIVNDDLGDAFAEFISKTATAIAGTLRAGGGLYLAMSPQEFALVHRALVGAGHHWSSTIIWAKDSLVIGRKDYHPQYEPIWYGWREGAPRAVPVVDRKQSDLWSIPRPRVSEEHPTMKPVELVLRALMNSSKPGALVFEPFSGSGTTIIASEQAGRRCRAIELDPQYVQVAVDRWEKMTGKKARVIK